MFAPSNAAFSKLPGQVVANVTSNQALLTKILENHIVFGKKLMLDDLMEEDVLLENILGSPLRVNLYRKSKFYRVSFPIGNCFQSTKKVVGLCHGQWQSGKKGGFDR